MTAAITRTHLHHEICGWLRGQPPEGLPSVYSHPPYLPLDFASTERKWLLRGWLGEKIAVRPDHLGLRLDATSPAEIAKSP